MTRIQQNERRREAAYTETTKDGEVSDLRSTLSTRQRTAWVQILASGILRAMLGLTLVFFLSGCVSPSAYLADRGRDAADIFTVTLGAGVGAKARAGFLQTGLLLNNDLYGLRGGAIHRYPFFFNRDAERDDEALAIEYDLLVIGMGASMVPGSVSAARQKRNGFFMIGPLCLPLVLVDYDDQRPLLPHLTQVEAVVGLGPSIRLGVNPGEFVDFLLGFFGIDIYADDIGLWKPPESDDIKQRGQQGEPCDNKSNECGQEEGTQENRELRKLCQPPARGNGIPPPQP